MSSSVAAMIDASLPCLRCGAKGPPGSCDCLIKLVCPTCGTMRWVGRQLSVDPVSAVELRANCLNCEPPGPGDVHYFDRLGREVPL